MNIKISLFFFLFFNFSLEAQESKNSWGLQNKFPGHIHTPNLKKLPIKTSIIAIIDSGIDSNHPLLAKALYLPPREGKLTKNHYGIDFSQAKNKGYQPIDHNGHGTHIAGIIHSVDPSAKLLIIKYYNPLATKEENMDSVLRSLRYAIESSVDIINYSSVGVTPSSEELQLLQEAGKKGILVVAAAGNQGWNIDHEGKSIYPAHYDLDNLLIVMAHDQNATRYKSSNYGASNVDVSAPGNEILSTLPFSQIGIKSGTSQATAFTTGAVSVLKSYFPKLSAQQIKKMIVENCEKMTQFKDLLQCKGTLNLERALGKQTQ